MKPVHHLLNLVTIAVIGAAQMHASDDAVGPFQWARKLLDADPGLQVPQDFAANGVIESAVATAESDLQVGGITLTQWTATNQAGTYSTGGNTLRGSVGKTYAIGMNGWTNYEAVNTGSGWVNVARMQQDAKIALIYCGSQQTPAALTHGAVLSMDSPMPAPALALVLVFRRVQGGQGDSGWQTGWYNGNPLSMCVMEIPQGKTLTQAQAEPNAIRRLATLDAMAEINPDMAFQIELLVSPGGQWQASMDLDGDGLMDVDVRSGMNGAKPYSIGDIDQTGGLYVMSAPAMGSPTGTVGVSTFNLTYRETAGVWQNPLRNRRPIKVNRHQISRVSPAVFQGGAWKADRSVSITAPGQLDKFTNGMFLARVPLDLAGEGTQVVISQSGSPSTDVPVAIQWQTTSVASGGAYTIRKGDSLLLVADDGYVDERNVIIDPYDDGSDLRYGVGSTRHRVSYNESGTYVATAYHDMNGDGIGSPTESLGSIAIQVVDFSFPSYVPCQVGYGRELIIDTGAMNSDQVLLSPAIAGSIAIGSLSKAGTSIMTTINPAVENSPVLQAKNVDGAILAARQISTFVFSEPTGSKMLASAWYPDGTVRVGGEYTISPMRLDLDVIVRIFTTGSAFDDGGIELRMSSNDFSLDKFGVAHGIFSIVRSGKSSSAPCHTAVVKYKETIVGR